MKGEHKYKMKRWHKYKMRRGHKYKMKRWHKYKMRRGHKYKMDKYGLLYAVMQFVAAWGLRFVQKIVGGGLLWGVLTYKVGSGGSNIASARRGGGFATVQLFADNNTVRVVELENINLHHYV